MSRLSQNAFELSPARRALLDRLLQREAVESFSEQRIPRQSRLGSTPTSFAQERLWFLEQLNPGGATYNVPTAYCLHGRLDTTALELSLNEIVRRHEVLRTTFVVIDEQSVQVVDPTPRVTLPLVDLRHTPEAVRAVKAQRLIEEEARRPFDLTHDLLLRAVLWQLGEGEYLLSLTLHHIASDGWSMEVFNHELSILYAAFADDQPSPLPDLPLQYADFAVWQRQWLQGETLASQLAYWQQQLADSPSVLELPTDRPRPATQTYRGATYSFTLSPALSKSLKALSQQEGVTLFMTLLAAFKVLLYRYTGQRDLVVGTPIANRNRVELEGLIGFFVNTLVLRTEVSGALRFRELLRQVREVCLGAYAHQDLPFEKLVEVLHPERDLSRNPLFQVMFVLQNSLMETLSLGDLTIHPLELEGQTALFDLTLSAEETPDGLKGTWEYSTDLFDTATLVRMAGHFQTLLEGIVTQPEERLSELSLLTPEEHHQLLVEWNDTQVDYPQNKCIHELFEAQVERTPNAVAVVFGSRQLTYRELNCRANQLAHYLRKLGVGPEVLVGLCLERSLEMVVGLLGILKAGGAYVPLDPAYPTQHLATILQNIQVRLLISQADLVPILPAIESPVLLMDRDWETVAHADSCNPERAAEPPNLAYVICTSGSTGIPKGVMLPHRALVQYVTAALRHFEIASCDYVLQFASISFDAAAEEIYPCLIGGARLVLRTDGMLDSIETFIHECTARCITVLDLPTAYWHAMLAQFKAGLLDFSSSLRLIILGGEAASAERLATWQAQAPDRIRLVNTYGPTETTIVATMCDLVKQSVPDDVLKVPIGRPVVNTQVYVLDPDWQPVPVGVPGELYIGGTDLARGYLKRPDLTAEKFIPDPFSDDPGSRLYRTGDLARYQPDGNIEFLGRIDYQVKVRGFRIELGEIEGVLGQYPGVQAAVVVTREEQIGSKRLVAYIVPNEPRPAAIELRSFLQAKLPEYMVPSTFVMLKTLPLTPNGKVDRRALPALEQDRPELAQTFVTPNTPTEQVVAKIWAEILGLERVGIHNNFFELGGHSLLAAQVVSRVRVHFQIEVPLTTLFKFPTVAGMAASIDAIYWTTQNLSALNNLVADREEGDL